MGRVVGFWSRAGTAFGLLAVVWALAHGLADSATDPAGGTLGNRAPILISNAPDGRISVRAGERTTLVVEALDPDLSASGGPELVWLSAAFSRDGGRPPPDWLAEPIPASGPLPRARLEIDLAPPLDAAPGSHRLVAGATDARGLSAVRAYEVTVLGPLCGGALEVLEDRACRLCPEHSAPNASRTGCEPCPAGTERPTGSDRCAACPAGLASETGGACSCGPTRLLAGGICVDCPPDTESAASGDACVACPPGTARPAGAGTCAATMASGGAFVRKSFSSRNSTSASSAPSASGGASVGKSASAPDTTAPSIASALYAGDAVTLRLSELVWAETTPATSDFTLSVMDGGHPLAVTVTALSLASRAADAADEITLTLSSELGGSAVVSVTYTANPTPLRRPRDAAGNRLATQTVAASPLRTLTVAFDTLPGGRVAEDAGRVNARLTLLNPPTTGTYTGCRLRLGAGSDAETPADVTFSNQKKLRPENGWTAQAGFMTVVDDALAEGDEMLVVEGHCTGSRAGTDPSHIDLASQPFSLTIIDNDTLQPLTLSLSPNSIGETLGGQRVTVTASVDSAPTSDVTVSLNLGTGAYGVTGTQRLVIAAGKTTATTELAFTPSDDSNATDDLIAVGGTAAGYAVTEASLTIREPILVGGADLSGLDVSLSVSPTAIREGASGAHAVMATLTGAPTPTVDVAFTLAVGGTATEGTAHDFTLSGAADWRELTVAANDAHLTASTSVMVAARADDIDEGEEMVTFSVPQVTWGTTAVALPIPATATLRITEAWSEPPAPTGLEASPSPGNERHGLDLVWEAVSASPPVDGYVVRHREVAQPELAWTTLAGQPGLAAAVAGLKAGTRYEVQVRARNAAGTGAPSGSVFAYTAAGDCTVGAPRVTMPSSALSSTELEVSWDAASCEPAVTVASYLVRYREDPAIEGMVNDWSRDTASGRTATLASLTPDTAYVVEVRAVEAGGDRGSWSSPGKGRTGLDSRLPPRVGAPTVAALGAERLNASWARVTWTDGVGVAHPIAEYQHRHRPQGGAWTAATDATASAAETTRMTRALTGLDAGTWHEVQVRGVNRMNGVAYPGKWSEPGRGRTWGPPDRVEEPSAYLTGTAVEVVWEAPNNGGSPITDYDVQYKASRSGGWTAHPYAGCGAGVCATAASIAAAAQKVRVRAENAVGMGAWSPTAQVQARKLLRLSFSQAEASVEEGRSLRVAARLDSAADRPLSVPLTTQGGMGAFRLDSAAGNMIAYGIGETERAFTLVALQDADSEDETVTIGFGDLPDGVLLAVPASLAVTIDDDEPGNDPPAFTEGLTATRTVAENAAAGAAVGNPVAATDPNSDALAYRLVGADASPFEIDAATGQLRVADGAALDFEGRTTSYAFVVEVGDGRDASGLAEASPAMDTSIAVTVSVTDLAEPPSAPAVPTLKLGATTLEVEWNEPGNTGPPITGYDVFHRAAGASQWTDASFEGAGTRTIIAGLPPGSSHEVYVRAVNAEGAGPQSTTATATTLPEITVTVDDAFPAIPVDNTRAPATLTARVVAAEGTLNGRWVRQKGDVLINPMDTAPFEITSGQEYTATFYFHSPLVRTYGLMVTHGPNTAHGEVGMEELLNITWLPSVVLSVSPTTVAEDVGAQTVEVTATLTGTAVENVAKTVDVQVAGVTATALDDFAEVDSFRIEIPAGARDASGSFDLAPVLDTETEGNEAVAVGGTASQGDAAPPVIGAAVTITNVARHRLTVTTPTNGTVTGTIRSVEVINCGNDCEEIAAGGTAVALRAVPASGYGFSSWGDACAGAASANCSVRLDANKTVSVAFGVPVDGRCHDSRANSCAAGRHNPTAYVHTSTHYYWRCDGLHGGRNRVCEKAKHDCAGLSRRGWSVGSNICWGAITNARSGETRVATDSEGPTTGTATFSCDDGRWIRQTEGTCSSN